MTTFDITTIVRRAWSHRGLWLALAVGFVLKAAILITRSITFDADEAVLGVMARHIMAGERPVFFYGQSYMGALDAYLTVPFFLIFGQNVTAMRLLQVALYAGVLITTYLLALRLSDRFGAFVAAMLIAAPTTLFSLYTSSTLGDYVEILLFNNLLLLIGHDLITGQRKGAGWWFLLGVIAGLAWWSMALVVVAALPLIVLGIVRLRRSIPWVGVGIAVVGFLIGALPWLYATLARGFGATITDMSGAWFSGPSSPTDRALSLILFNLPALFGLRPPWSIDWIVLPLGLLLVALYGLILWHSTKYSIARQNGEDSHRTLAVLLIFGWPILLILFLMTPFGGDPTGRYLLPLWPNLAVLTGWWLARLRSGELATPGNRGAIAGWVVLAVIVAYNLTGNIGAIVRNPPGLTKQFDPISQIPEDHDDELVQFLDSIGADRGYSNYWVTFRFAFLTNDRIIFSPRLPYKADLSYTYGDDRYPPYSQAVDVADKVVYVTSNHPLLDQRIGERLADLNVTFDLKTIGPYTVFYNLSRKVTPDDLGPFGKVTGAQIHSGN
jgi:4-amino-4-deoxy-L-arabinose transferase-like glycosyltransferase